MSLNKIVIVLLSSLVVLVAALVAMIAVLLATLTGCSSIDETIQSTPLDNEAVASQPEIQRSDGEDNMPPPEAEIGETETPESDATSSSAEDTQHGIRPADDGMRRLDPADFPDGLVIRPMDELEDFDGFTLITDSAGNIRMLLPDMTREVAEEWYRANAGSPFFSDETLALFRAHFGLDD